MHNEKLQRSTDDRVFMGVCGGLGEHFGVDAVWIRLAFVALALMGGPGIIAYLVMVLVVPKQASLPSADRAAFQSTALRSQGRGHVATR